MGIFSNTVSICHFKVMGEFTSPDDLEIVAHEFLASQSFNPIDDSTEELSIGWVHTDDPKEHDFANPATCWRDHYLMFSLRRDQRKVPAAYLKEQTEKAQAAWLEENPSFTRVPKQKREELKEVVRAKLLAKTLPDPKVYDVVWDTQTGIVTFTTLSAKTIEIMEDLFKRTFEGLRLTAFHPYERAMGCLDSNGQRLLAAANRATGGSYLELIKENVWLGMDFMGWLLFRTMTGDADNQVNRPGPMLHGESFVSYIDDRVVLAGHSDNGTQMITVDGPQDRFNEVKSALQGCKRISEATIHLEADEEHWKLTLKGEMFHFASFSSPAVKIEKDNTADEQLEREAVFFERMALLEKGLQLFDSLFTAFLQIRLGGDWGDVEAAIFNWIMEG